MNLNPLRSSHAARPAARSSTTAGGAKPAGEFAPPAGAGRPASAAQAAPVTSLASLEALVALQSVDGPLERRRRVARRGLAILDDLDALKLAILEGRVALADLQRLRRLVASAREDSDDSELEELIDGIELRAEVEIAKLGG